MIVGMVIGSLLTLVAVAALDRDRRRQERCDLVPLLIGLHEPPDAVTMLDPPHRPPLFDQDQEQAR